MAEEKPTVFTSVADSGSRQDFQTGSVRDTDVGKGNPSLLPMPALIALNNAFADGATDFYHTHYLNQSHELIWWILMRLLELNDEKEIARENFLNRLSELFWQVSVLIEMGDDTTITVGDMFTKLNSALGLPFTKALRRLSVHYQNGAVKYKKNNWRKGQPISRYFDSSFRHFLDFVDGKTNEDHLAALLWNIVGMYQTRLDTDGGFLSKELDDFPLTKDEILGKVKE